MAPVSTRECCLVTLSVIKRRQDDVRIASRYWRLPRSFSLVTRLVVAGLDALVGSVSKTSVVPEHTILKSTERTGTQTPRRAPVMLLVFSYGCHLLPQSIGDLPYFGSHKDGKLFHNGFHGPGCRNGFRSVKTGFSSNIGSVSPAKISRSVFC